ncbi:MAG: hypothetical protein EOO41_02150, partial [Methanobacteriota archaeon]
LLERLRSLAAAADKWATMFDWLREASLGLESVGCALPTAALRASTSAPALGLQVEAWASGAATDAAQASGSGGDTFAASIALVSQRADAIFSTLRSTARTCQAQAAAIAELKSSISTAASSRLAADDMVANALAERRKEAAARASAEVAATKAARREAALQQENSTLRALLATYSAEARRFGDARPGADAEVSGMGVDSVDVWAEQLAAWQAQCTQRVAELERCPSPLELAAAQAQVTSLQAECASLRAELRTLYAGCAHLFTLPSAPTPPRIRADVERAEAGIDTQAITAAATSGVQLEEADMLVGGRASDSGTRILRCVVNPTSSAFIAQLRAAKAQIEALSAEAEALRVAHAEARSASAASEGAAASAAHASQLLAASSAAARQQSLQTETLRKRLLDTFKQRTAQLRKAVYLLTGYEIHMQPAADGGDGVMSIRLKSTYNELPDDCLQFNIAPDDGVELLQTPFVQRLNKELFAYLNTSHSVPAFLACVTLELLGKQTMTCSVPL